LIQTLPKSDDKNYVSVQEEEIYNKTLWRGLLQLELKLRLTLVLEK